MQIHKIDAEWARSQSPDTLGKMTADLHGALAQAFPEGFSWTEQTIQTSLHNRFHQFFYMRDQATSEIVTVAHFQLIFDEAELFNIGVVPSHQRRGLAKQVLQYVLDHYQNQDVATVTLEVRSRNQAARKLYESLGFKQIASRPDYYPINLDDAIIYQIQLNQI
jgi:ribosomal-protein-alanine N-acetyltransferase